MDYEKFNNYQTRHNNEAVRYSYVLDKAFGLKKFFKHAYDIYENSW